MRDGLTNPKILLTHQKCANNAHTMYENQKEDSIDFILELIIDSISTVKSCPLSSRSYFLICREYRDSIWYVESLGIQLERTGRDNMSKEEGENRIDWFIYLFWSGYLRMYIYIRICQYPCTHIHLARIDRYGYMDIDILPGTRFELVTRGFSVLCSTNWAIPALPCGSSWYRVLTCVN